MLQKKFSPLHFFVYFMIMLAPKYLDQTIAATWLFVYKLVLQTNLSPGLDNFQKLRVAQFTAKKLRVAESVFGFYTGCNKDPKFSIGLRMHNYKIIWKI